MENKKRKRATRILKNSPLESEPEGESEASRIFRTSQLELLEAVRAKDPDYDQRQWGQQRKNIELDRDLINEAVQEYEERMGRR